MPEHFVPLLGASDPPPFEVLHGGGGAPLLLTCDHASRKVPRALAGLGLDDELLSRHIGWDIGAAAVTRCLSRQLDAPAVLCGYSRLVIDCNRDPDDPSSIPEVSDGITVPGNRSLPPDARAARRTDIFVPYHSAIDAKLAGFAARGTAPAVLSIHSFTPVMNGHARPWHVGILWDEDPRIAVPLIAALAADMALVVGDNQPYSAREPKGYTQYHHAARHGLPHVAIELRQDLITDEVGAAAWADLLAAVLQPVLSRPEIYRIRSR